MSFHRPSVREKQKRNRRLRLEQGIRGGQQGTPTGVRPFKRGKSGRINHKRSPLGGSKWARKAAVQREQALAVERLTENQARIAALRAQGLPLPGQSPTNNPATVRKG